MLPRAHTLACYLLLGATLLAALSGCAFAQNDPAKEEWLQLFNGRNLDGWLPKITGYPLNENYGNTFRVENGTLRVAYDQYTSFDSRFGHIFYKDPFTYYRIRVEYRFTGNQAPGGPGWATRNSGIMIHGQPPHTMGKDQDFPISIEVQLLGGLGKGARSTANLCTPGTHVVMDGKLETRHCIPSTSDTSDGDQWVTAEVLALGESEIVHFVNGKQVHRYVLPQVGGANVSKHQPSAKQDGALLRGGSISLQSESHPVEFRKVELLNLEGCMDDKARNYKSYYVKAKNAACLY
ncbi:MAG: DUF1080 domain-containing protein [Bryobacterales bacterium]|jgi:hypothetical protein|nr:DUF1080 domain-containing protein [Bryobacterales bacterium]